MIHSNSKSEMPQGNHKLKGNSHWLPLAKQDRRHFLQGLGVSLALPMLESWGVSSAAVSRVSHPVKRIVCVGTYLGFHQSDFFPEQTGRRYDMPYVLEPLAGLRDRFSIFSGLDHRGRNGHEGWQAWMSGSATGSVSMDQLVAEHVGHHTRYASLQLTCGTPPDVARLSFSKEGVALPMMGRPSVLYQTLFRSDSDRSRLEYVLRGNGSLLDDVLEESRTLKRKVSRRDQGKVDEYLASVRDVEKNGAETGSLVGETLSQNGLCITFFRSCFSRSIPGM